MTADFAVAHPLAVYATVAIGMLLCVALFVSVKFEVRKYALRAARAERALDALGQDLRTALDGFREDLDTVERHAGLLVPPQQPRSGMNLSARSQALRMHRRGESAEQIAAALSIPLQEVELLLKVHRIVLENV